METLPILRWKNEARGRFRLPIQTSNSTIYRAKCRFVKGHRIVERWNAFLLSVDVYHVAPRPWTFFCEASSQRRFKDIVETYRLPIIGTRVAQRLGFNSRKNKYTSEEDMHGILKWIKPEKKFRWKTLKRRRIVKDDDTIEKVAILPRNIRRLFTLRIYSVRNFVFIQRYWYVPHSK